MGTLSYSFTRWGWWTASVSIPYTVSYDAATNRSTLSFGSARHEYTGQKNYASTATTAITVSAGDNPGSSGSASFATQGTTLPSGRSYYATPGPASITVQHSAGPGAKTVTIAASTTVSARPNETYSVNQTNSGSGSKTETSHTVPAASAIAGVSSEAETLGTVSLTMNRYDAAYWHKARFLCGETLLAESAPFETTLSQSVPRGWFSGYPTATSLAVTVSVQTYASSACTSAVGSPATASLTVTADAGMAPVLAEGCASAAPDNTGTAAAGITGYVSGVSRALVTVDETKIDLSAAAGATIERIEVTGGGVTVTQAPYRTGVLSGTAALTVTVTDSRGRRAAQTLRVVCMPYAPPTLSGVEVFRCLSDGTASENGTACRIRATAGCAGLDGQNSVTLTARFAQGSGGYGSAVSLTSGAAQTVPAGLDPDQRASVKLKAEDALGSVTETVVTLPGRRWALKFRPDGLGAAFGKAPEYGSALELPADWDLRFGSESWLDRVWPVGSVYLTVGSADPAALFGGSWERAQAGALPTDWSAWKRRA